MLSEICKELRNWFVTVAYSGTFEIVDGKLLDMDDKLQEGQYYRIIGSVFNDGVHYFSPSHETSLHDERFNGAVWAMAVPSEVIALAEDVEAWRDKYAGVDSAAMSPYQSESFGGYSYSKSGSAGDEAGGGTWQSVFASRLNNWRKIR